MPIARLLVATLTLAASAAVTAQDFTTVCHASSSYDLTVTPDALRFDRAAPAPRLLEWRAGQLRADGAKLPLNREDSDRLALFDEDLRALLPKARRVASAGVDLAIVSLRAEAVSLGLSADTKAELSSALDTHAAELKRRIARSSSTHDWQGEAFDRYVEAIAADVTPLLAADLAQQALTAVMAGDLDAAASLRDRAASLASELRPRLQRRMQALRPEVESLCPPMQRLYDLQRGVRGANGQALDLLLIERD